MVERFDYLDLLVNLDDSEKRQVFEIFERWRKEQRDAFKIIERGQEEDEDRELYAAVEAAIREVRASHRRTRVRHTASKTKSFSDISAKATPATRTRSKVKPPASTATTTKTPRKKRKPEKEKLTVTIYQIAEALGVVRSTAHLYIKHGAIKVKRVGVDDMGRTLYRVHEYYLNPRRDLLTTNEALKVLGVSRSTLWREEKRRRIRKVMNKGRLRWPRCEVLKLLKRRSEGGQ